MQLVTTFLDAESVQTCKHPTYGEKLVNVGAKMGGGVYGYIVIG